MSNEGTVLIHASIAGGPETLISALVTFNLKDEILVSWHDLRTLGVLGQDFPNVIKMVTPCHANKLEEIKEEFKDILSNTLSDTQRDERPTKEDTPLR